MSVEEMSAAQAIIAEVAPMRFLAVEHVREWDCHCTVYLCGLCLLEFIVPKSGPLLKWAQERGGTGLHHIAFQVGDIEATCRRLRASGVDLLTEQPVTGVLGWKVNFIRPKKYGVLIELVEPT